MLLAEVLIEKGHVVEAEEALRRGKEIVPRSAMARGMEGVLRERQGRTDAALECFRDSVRLNPHDVPLRRQLIESLDCRGLEEAAEAEMKELRKLYPGLR